MEALALDGGEAADFHPLIDVHSSFHARVAIIAGVAPDWLRYVLEG